MILSELCFYFVLGNFFMLFRVSQSFPKVGEGEFLGKNKSAILKHKKYISFQQNL